MPRLPSPVVALCASLLAAGCAGSGTSARSSPDGYLAAMPTNDMSGALTRAFESVKQIQVSVTYELYFFPEDGAPTGRDLAAGDVTSRATATDAFAETSRATAVLVSSTPRSVLLLTAAHAVARADTVIEYFGADRELDHDEERRIRSLSIKSRQTNWVTDLPGSRTFEVIAVDEEEDVALIGFRTTSSAGLGDVRPMPVSPGDPGALSLGSFVYILGYPGGFPMVSQGVATPVRDGRGSFVVDGNWNQGVSGGAVLAVTRDGRGLEWIGMARASAAEREIRLVPSVDVVESHDPALPYRGPVFLEETLRVQYGITLSVPMTVIERFIERSAPTLRRLGYSVPLA
jgi:hypothetical protein